MVRTKNIFKYRLVLTYPGSTDGLTLVLYKDHSFQYLPSPPSFRVAMTRDFGSFASCFAQDKGPQDRLEAYAETTSMTGRAKASSLLLAGSVKSLVEASLPRSLGRRVLAITSARFFRTSGPFPCSICFAVFLSRKRANPERRSDS